MKKFNLILLVFALCLLPAVAQRPGGPMGPRPNGPRPEQPKGKPEAQPSKNKKQGKKSKKPAAQSARPSAKPASSKGLFGVIKQENDYFLEVPDSLIGRDFLVTVRFTETPGSVGKYAGEQVNEQTLYFEKAPDDKLLLRSRLLLNVSDTLNAINRAVEISNSSPIIAAFKNESKAKGVYKIKVTQLFNEDNGALSLPSYSKQQYGLANVVPSLSYIESVKTFPLNTEVRVVKTYNATAQSRVYAARATGKVTIGLNISFVLLPKVPMIPRQFDPRVGYFADGYTYYSDFQQRVENKRFITRWRLEPKDSIDAEKIKRGELVEPKKPIIYYIDPATPKQWRPYLIAGIEDWQVAFEKAGFKNAILAREWPDSDKTMSMEDARYSVVRYLASPTENAYGPNVHDPRSGEILESHICWYHNVMTLVHDWYMIQAGTIDEAARQMKYDTELMGQLIRFVSSHEVGHTLGLRHNMGSSSTVPVDSLRSKSFVEANGHTPSIMDYARFNYVAQPEDGISQKGIFPRIGDYDKWAIEWGYRPMFDAYDDVSDHYELEKLVQKRFAEARVDSKLNNQPRIWFGDGETNTTNDSRCQTEDLGDDAVKASYYGILNLKREIKALPDWTYQQSDNFGQNLSDIYGHITNQLLRYCGHVIGNIGGVYKDYRTVEEGGIAYKNVPRTRQKECLDFIDNNILHEPTWLIAEDYAKSLAPDVQMLTIQVGNNVINRLIQSRKLDRMTTEYSALDYLTDLSNTLFSEAKGGSDVSPYRKALQQTFVQTLVRYYQASTLSSPARPAVLYVLNNLNKSLSSPKGNIDTQAHFASLSDAITRALNINNNPAPASATPSAMPRR